MLEKALLKLVWDRSILDPILYLFYRLSGCSPGEADELMVERLLI